MVWYCTLFISLFLNKKRVKFVLKRARLSGMLQQMDHPLRRIEKDIVGKTCDEILKDIGKRRAKNPESRQF